MPIQTQKIQVEISGQMVDFTVNFIYTPAEQHSWDCPGDIEDVTILSLEHEESGEIAKQWLVDMVSDQAIEDILDVIHRRKQPKPYAPKPSTSRLENYINNKQRLANKLAKSAFFN